MNFLIQFLGFLAITSWLIGTQAKNKKGILFSQIVSSTFYCIQYIFLKAYTGAIIDVITIFRNILFYFEEKKNKNMPKKFLIIFAIIIILTSIFSSNNIFCILIIIASLLYLFALWIKNLFHTRLLCIIAAICWCIYNFLVGAYINCFGNILEIILLIIAIFRYKENNNEEV